MITQILLVIAGLLLVVLGAEGLVSGASAIARRLNVSEFVIGLTIVGFGTSLPELVVSVTGAIEGNSAISVGNVIGSNIFNTLLILGLTAIILPVSITDQNRRRDIPVMALVTLLLIACGYSKSLAGLGSTDGISRVEGVVFLILFAFYLYLSFKKGEAGLSRSGTSTPDAPSRTASGRAPDSEVSPSAEKAPMRMLPAVLFTLAGLAGLVTGGRLFVDNSVEIARAIGVSDKFIAITLLAGGTSLPELAACVVAAARKKGQLALGNILGSNIFNILLIIGTSAAISPVSFDSVNAVDLSALAVSAALVWLSAYTLRKDRIGRAEGVVFTLCFAAYFTWLFINL